MYKLFIIKHTYNVILNYCHFEYNSKLHIIISLTYASVNHVTERFMLCFISYIDISTESPYDGQNSVQIRNVLFEDENSKQKDSLILIHLNKEGPHLKLDKIYLDEEQDNRTKDTKYIDT